MTNPESIQYAGFWRRLLAFILDSFLFGAVVVPFLVLIYGRDYFYWSSEQTGMFPIYGIADFLLTTLLPVVLIIGFWTRLGAMGQNQLTAFRLFAFLLGIQLVFGFLFGSGPQWIAEVAGFGDSVAGWLQ